MMLSSSAKRVRSEVAKGSLNGLLIPPATRQVHFRVSGLKAALECGLDALLSLGVAHAFGKKSPSHAGRDTLPGGLAP